MAKITFLVGNEMFAVFTGCPLTIVTGAATATDALMIEMSRNPTTHGVA